jgi:hypothetical protein
MNSEGKPAKILTTHSARSMGQQKALAAKRAERKGWQVTGLTGSSPGD